MYIELKGASRIVFVFDNVVLKIPNVRRWKNFLCGLLANMQERSFGTTELEGFCPVLFTAWGGWFLVMRKATEMTSEQFETFDPESFCRRKEYGIPAEHKPSSFGFLEGRVVAIDYG